VVFYRLQFVLAAESWRRRFGPSLRVWLDTVGELEALAALGGYTYEHPADVFPEFVESTPCFEAQGLAHPLLPQNRSIANDLRLGPDLQLIMVSGPNMAGKSTFLRGIGVNAVLAQCGAPVRAASLKLSPLQVTASICVLDSLEGGVSRFYAEIRRLKQIMDLTNGAVPVLFLLDELLSGTNSHDRLIGTRSFVTKLVERGAVGLVSTHDLALTAIPQEIGSKASNGHFKDHVKEGQLCFDYKLYPGIVQTSNALVLMRSIGLEV
jgi:DNA mismatch repair ATPase MutS